ncbi:trihelix transcription factor PTL-like [Vigna unguiculata]|uniref:Myb-like domain-containing protein n=1 Tax=Vigna unguiculata TaxID=3917 RepID=A0A4D6MXZ7_VIGUN|nr:trihelix transcription factor PTL-like [Vigna unguiculata]QCE05928.1 hypothetical protein DEO72_LG9g937 [Vigna unguiculata]
MEMEDHHHHHRHHHHHHHHHQQQQNHHHQQHQHQHHFAVNDLRQVVNAPRTSHNTFPSMPPHPTAELFPGHRNLAPLPTPQHHQQHYEVMMFGRDIMPPSLHDFTSTPHDPAAAAAAAAPTMALPTPPAFDAEGAACIAGDPSTGRWPRQETLTLLEIRSRLDPKFKEANHKGPLWDEVSRIMSEEHGYQRSGKKCREKFENLYKYYKKTKDGKAGRHDGKHYRFFRQLEALYGENSSTVSVPETNVVGSIHFQASSHDPSQTNQDKFQSHNGKHCDSLSLTNSTNFDTTSSDDDNDHHSMENESIEKRRKRNSGRSWKVKIKDFIDSQMKKLVEKQKEWLDKLVKTLEEKEKERVLREEEWRKQEANRLEREQKFWAKERAWIEARDAALMEALQKLTGREIIKAETPNEGINVTPAEVQNHSENQNNEDESEILNRWPESEITRLQQLRAEIETRFPCSEISEDVSWEVVATKMACFGYERSALMCKEKWESMSNYPREGGEKEGSKKCKENSRNCFFFKNNDDHRQSSLYDQGSGYCDDMSDQGKEIERLQTNNSSSPSKSNAGNVDPSDSCFPFLMSTEGGNLWENYGLKLNKENQNH